MDIHALAGREKRFLRFVVAYNAERTIQEVIRRVLK